MTFCAPRAVICALSREYSKHIPTNNTYMHTRAFPNNKSMCRDTYWKSWKQTPRPARHKQTINTHTHWYYMTVQTTFFILFSRKWDCVCVNILWARCYNVNLELFVLQRFSHPLRINKLDIIFPRCFLLMKPLFISYIYILYGLRFSDTHVCDCFNNIGIDIFGYIWVLREKNSTLVLMKMSTFNFCFSFSSHVQPNTILERQQPIEKR